MIKRVMMAAAFAALACAVPLASAAKAMPTATGVTLQVAGDDLVTPAKWKEKHWNRGRYSGRNRGRHLGWYKQRGRYYR